jgi:hypothetical protein
MASFQFDIATGVTLLSTELNALSNGSTSAVGTEYDNSAGIYTMGLFEVLVTFGSAPSATGLIDLFLVSAPDGTNYTDGGGSVLPPSTDYAGAFPLRAVTTAQRVRLGGGPLLIVALPPAKFKVAARNAAGTAFPATGSTVVLYPYRIKSV